MSKIQRLEWIDISKAFGITFVMFGHCYLKWQYCFWFYSFHMALFFFLSGYTFALKSGGYLDFLKKKSRVLLVPYIFFAVCTIIINSILAITHGNSYDFLYIGKQYLLQNRYTLLWFLTCLFLAQQIMYVIDKVISKLYKKNIYFFVSVCFFIIFFVYRRFIDVDLPWNADLSILAVAFMCIGKQASITFKDIDISRNKRIIGSIVLFIVSVLVAFINFEKFSWVDWYSDKFGNPILFIFAAIFGVFSIILLSKSINSKFLAYLGKNSLVYYGLHRIIIDLMFVVYGKFGIAVGDSGITAVMCAIISVLVSVCVLTLCNLFINKWCPWCIGKKKVVKND